MQLLLFMSICILYHVYVRMYMYVVCVHECVNASKICAYFLIFWHIVQVYLVFHMTLT